MNCLVCGDKKLVGVRGTGFQCEMGECESQGTEKCKTCGKVPCPACTEDKRYAYLLDRDMLVRG